MEEVIKFIRETRNPNFKLSSATSESFSLIEWLELMEEYKKHNIEKDYISFIVKYVESKEFPKTKEDLVLFSKALVKQVSKR